MCGGTERSVSGRVKDEFLSDKLNRVAYKIDDPVRYLLWRGDRVQGNLDCNKHFEYVRLDRNHFTMVDKFVQHGFNSICLDAKLIRRKIPNYNFRISTNVSIRTYGELCPALPTQEQLSQLADCFRASRFNLDYMLRPYFNPIKMGWIINVFERKYAYRLYVAYYSGQLAGFMSVNDNEDIATIDLIAVLPQFRDRNIGLKLLSSLTDFRIVYVSTQMTNKIALKFYSKAGFKLSEVYSVLHKHS